MIYIYFFLSKSITYTILILKRIPECIIFKEKNKLNFSYFPVPTIYILSTPYIKKFCVYRKSDTQWGFNQINCIRLRLFLSIFRLCANQFKVWPFKTSTLFEVFKTLIPTIIDHFSLREITGQNINIIQPQFLDRKLKQKLPVTSSQKVTLYSNNDFMSSLHKHCFKKRHG